MSRTPPRSPAAGLAMLAGAGVLWGGSGSVGRLLATMGHLGPVQIGAVRPLIGGTVLLVLAVALRRPRVAGAVAWRRVGVMAASTAAYQVCFFAAVAAGSISVATLVTLGSTPLFVTAVEAVRLRRLPALDAVVLVVALTGLALLVGPGVSASATVGAAVLPALGAGLAFAVITLVSATPVSGGDPLSTTGVALGLAGVALGLVASVAGGPISWTPAVAAWLLVIGVVCTAAPFGLYVSGLQRSTPAVAALVALLEPLTATLLALSFFHERLAPASWVGAVLLLGAVAAGARRGHPPE